VTGHSKVVLSVREKEKKYRGGRGIRSLLTQSKDGTPVRGGGGWVVKTQPLFRRRGERLIHWDEN